MDISTEQLQRTVESQHCCHAKLAQTVPVRETFQEQPVWEGVVHVFDLEDHPKATRAYAWSSPLEGSDRRRFFAVLQLGAIQTPLDAVRAAIVAEHKGGSQMAKAFRYQRFENFDPLSKQWYVSHRNSGAYVGMIREEAVNNYAVRRPQDQSFHRTLGSRIEAARWLKEQQTDPAIFDEDDED